jgi:hypothetical protein
MGPAGARCRDCASLRSSHLYQVAPERLALAAASGFGVCAAGGWALREVHLGGLFLLFWMGLILGGLAGEVVLRVGGRKRGTKVEIASAGSAFLGVLTGMFLWTIFAGLGPGYPGATGDWIHQGFGAIVAAAAAHGRIRHF